MRHLAAGQMPPSRLLLISCCVTSTGGSLCLIFAVRDQGGFDLIRSTKIVLLTPNTWGVWQLVVYNQAEDQATPPQIVAGGHISIELIIVLCVAGLTLSFYNCCALFCDVFAHTNTTRTQRYLMTACSLDLPQPDRLLFIFFCQFAFHKIFQEMKRREADYTLFSHFLCFTDCQLSISSVTDKLVSLVPIRSNCQCGCCLLLFELPSRPKPAVRIVFVPPWKSLHQYLCLEVGEISFASDNPFSLLKLVSLSWG